MSRRLGYLAYILVFVLVLTFVWLIAARKEKFDTEQKLSESETKSKAQTCTLNGSLYSHGSLVRSGSKVLKCEGGRWRELDQ